MDAKEGVLSIMQMIVDDDLADFDLSNELGVNEVKMLFERLALRWNPIVEEDVAFACAGKQPRYFLPPLVFTEQYRQELGVYALEGSRLHREMHSGLRSAADIGAELSAQIKEHGFWFVANAGNGYACPVEQTKFYSTDAWQRRAASARYLLGYRCRACGAPGRGLHVHHLRPIKSAFSKTCFTNFDDGRMELMCETCHKRAHETLARSGHHFIYTSKGEAIESRKNMQEFWRVCHAKNLCDYCNYFHATGA